MKRVAWPWVLLGGLLLTSCETEHDRVMAEKFAAFPPNVRHAIARGYVMHGMTQEQVWLARGEPMCKKTITHKGRPVEVWLYPPGGPDPCQTAQYRVYFENGVVSGWKNLDEVPIRHLPRPDEEGGSYNQGQ
ncbi:hypothetical protein [Nitrospira sp. Kam-Ns4a]